MSLVVDPSVRFDDDFIHLFFLHTHLETTTLVRDLLDVIITLTLVRDLLDVIITSRHVHFLMKTRSFPNEEMFM